ncbi:MAG: hypothetical protein GXY83_07970 [Rhodopirellula sp.]|nr:hypothetical protein [Rhodopirellula sp.]
MNSLHRVVAALERRVPDRVPYFECAIDTRVMQYLLPGCDYFQFNDWLGMDNVGQNRSSWSRENVEFIGDDYADKNATMMSPRHFKEFILPGLQRCVDAAHEAGAYVVKHTDGNIMGILDMVVGTGIDALNPLEPQAGMDIGLIKQRYGDRTALIGNIDCGYVLSQAPLDEVRRTTRETIRKAAPGGGYCLSSSNSIHSSVKPENFMAMIDTWRQVGEYPIHD